MTPAATLKALRRLVRNIRGPSVPTLSELDELAADWVTLLPELSDADLEHAVTQILRSPSPYWPTVGQILAAAPVARRSRAIEDSAKSAAQRCFYEVVRWRKGQGPDYIGPVVTLLGHEGDAALEAQIQAGLGAIGGWRQLGVIEEAQLSWACKDFVAAVLAERGIAKVERQIAGPTLRAISGGGR